MTQSPVAWKIAQLSPWHFLADLGHLEDDVPDDEAVEHRDIAEIDAPE
ncbi:MAG: hypothetical protein ABIK09_06150 [Pseudomonadota bacterium]